MRLCANDFGNVATMDIPMYTGAKILDLGAEQPTAAELFWYPNLFWYTPARNWLVEATIASTVPLMWWGCCRRCPEGFRSPARAKRR
jgi:hypothetical protein